MRVAAPPKTPRLFAPADSDSSPPTLHIPPSPTRGLPQQVAEKMNVGFSSCTSVQIVLSMLRRRRPAIRPHANRQSTRTTHLNCLSPHHYLARQQIVLPRDR